MGLFGKAPERNPTEQVREWSKALRHEMRGLDRQIAQIQREENKVKREIKDAAKKTDKDVCRILAKEIVRSRKAVAKLYTSKAQINSVIMNITNQAATVRLAGCMQKSSDVMKSMQSLVKVAEVSAVMQQLSKEMMKAGIIEEMIDETVNMDDEEEMEEEIQAEVEKILFEVTAGELGKAPAVVRDLPAEQVASADLDNEEVEQMQARLGALRS